MNSRLVMDPFLAGGRVGYFPQMSPAICNSVLGLLLRADLAVRGFDISLLTLESSSSSAAFLATARLSLGLDLAPLSPFP